MNNLTSSFRYFFSFNLNLYFSNEIFLLKFSELYTSNSPSKDIFVSFELMSGFIFNVFVAIDSISKVASLSIIFEFKVLI
uniref:Uncharacterized protein n=1 Tax=Staphylococcus aureus TaxID=1280 RepID=Q936I9_STAAU|nr:unknown [Staphylococcus aureus]